MFWVRKETSQENLSFTHTKHRFVWIVNKIDHK